MGAKRYPPLLQRVWEKTEFPDGPSGCWLWQGSVDGHGHGFVGLGDRHVPVHRVTWQLSGRDVPAGSRLRHTCANPGCLNPDHLFLEHHYGTLEERFWRKVERRGPDECWPWTASTRYPDPARAYGEIKVNKKSRPAPQVAWELQNGRSFPEGMMACHTCDNPRCVNPSHIFPGTMTDNLLDCVSKGRHARFTLRGAENTMAKLTMEQARDIRSRYALGGVSQRKLATEYDVAQAQIGKIVRGESYREAALARIDAFREGKPT